MSSHTGDRGQRDEKVEFRQKFMQTPSGIDFRRSHLLPVVELGIEE